MRRLVIALVLLGAAAYARPQWFAYTPQTKMILYAIVGLVLFQLAMKRKEGFLDTNIIARADVERARVDLVGNPKQAKPVITIPALEEDIYVTRVDAVGQELGERRAMERGKAVQSELFDRKQAADQTLTNVREQDTTRGAILPTEDEQIFGTRPSVRDSNDGFRTMFAGVPNSGMKYIASVV